MFLQLEWASMKERLKTTALDHTVRCIVHLDNSLSHLMRCLGLTSLKSKALTFGWPAPFQAVVSVCMCFGTKGYLVTV